MLKSFEFPIINPQYLKPNLKEKIDVELQLFMEMYKSLQEDHSEFMRFYCGIWDKVKETKAGNTRSSRDILHSFTLDKMREKVEGSLELEEKNIPHYPTKWLSSVDLKGVWWKNEKTKT